jgi:hypothetical protein
MARPLGNRLKNVAEDFRRTGRGVAVGRGAGVGGVTEAGEARLNWPTHQVRDLNQQASLNDLELNTKNCAISIF